MLDPVTTPLLVLVLGNLAHEIIAGACKDHLKDKVKSVFGWLESLGQKDKVEPVYRDAMEQAYGSCLEMLLLNIKGFGYTDEELKQYGDSLRAFIRDGEVAEELVRFLREPGRDDVPSPDMLRKRWAELGGHTLPTEMLWNQVVVAFRRQATKRMILSDELRELLNAQNLQELKELIKRQGGVKVQVRRDKYSQRMRTKFSPVDLANLMPAYAEDPGRMVIRDVFVPQYVREDPPPIEIPKDLAERLKKGGRADVDEDTTEDLATQQLEKLRAAYVSQSPKPVLDVIAAPSNRLVVLTGDPGSGKSTLLRYLLTGIIEPPADPQSGKPLGWTESFKETFPLLIELRDFYALRQSDECDSFLEYVAYMGKTDQWFLDDHAVHACLENGPSLVMFDGLDEIFEAGDRRRVMQEIAGFAQRYPRARIVVTTRPVGYKEQVFRNAGFAHLGIQDLDDSQIETFVRGWFALTFPEQPQQAEQRTERVLGSVRQSKPIRLLAGNPMLLTIMALLAREQELPRERAKFYEKAMEVFCHHWDANKGLDLPGLEWLNVDDKLGLLRRVAMRMQTGPGGLAGNVIYEDDLEDEIKGWFIDRFQQPAHEAVKAARSMIDQLRERNYILCLRGPHLYGFVHRTFLEYLTAAEYVRRFDKQPQQMTIEELVELFDKHCRDDEWREVLRLICGHIDEQFVGRIVEHLATRTDPRASGVKKPLPELPLAIWCLSEVRNPTGLIRAGRKLMSQLLGFLRRGRQYLPLGSFMRNHVLAAVRELATRWPGKDELRRLALSFPEGFHGAGETIWAQVVAAVEADRQLIEELLMKAPRVVRNGAISVLSEAWPDERTRRLLEERAMKDENESTRLAALEALAGTWPDDATRKLLEERAVQDGEDGPRYVALYALSENWPDEKTRRLLEERAIKDESKYARRIALSALARTWPDENTRELLEERALQDGEDEARYGALYALSQNWLDDRTRRLLEERAIKDENKYPRLVALQALAETWPDENTRKLIGERAVEDPDRYVRHAALVPLADKWRDNRTRRLLEERAVQDDADEPRAAAIKALARTWPDENTRRLVTERAVQDEDEQPRRAALEALAETWPDDKTRRLLAERALQDDDEHPRRAALTALAGNWPDRSTLRLLESQIASFERSWHRSRIEEAIESLQEKLGAEGGQHP